MKISKVQLAAAAVVALGAVLAAPAHAGKTLDAIKARGQVACGVNTGLAGFAAADSSGKWSGLDVDVCKPLAAATLGDTEKVKYVPLNAQQRFTALQSGEVDVLARNTTGCSDVTTNPRPFVKKRGEGSGARRTGCADGG